MTGNKIRTQVVSCAAAFLGLNEKDGSHKKIIELYNSQPFLPRGYKLKDTDAWCAAFVTAVGARLGITQVLLPECSVGKMAELYKKATFYKKPDFYTPKPGDLVVYDWDGSGTGDHIGMVEWVYGQNMTVIEGNYKDAVARRTIKRNSSAVLGYCVPDYLSLAGKVDTLRRVQLALNLLYGAGLYIDGIYGKKTQKALITALQKTLGVDRDGIFGPVTEKALEKVVLGKDCQGEMVEILQMFLICNGYKLTADGIFGAKTENALRTYQKKTGLVPDGLAGKNTFQKLLTNS